jgi:predicted lipoprotein
MSEHKCTLCGAITTAGGATIRQSPAPSEDAVGVARHNITQGINQFGYGSDADWAAYDRLVESRVRAECAAKVEAELGTLRAAQGREG